MLEQFLEAIAEDADIDLVLCGRRARFMADPVRKLALGGREALEAMYWAPLYPSVFALLIQARKLGRTFQTRPVAERRELIVEIRMDTRRRSRER